MRKIKNVTISQISLDLTLEAIIASSTQHSSFRQVIVCCLDSEMKYNNYR